MSDEKTFLFFEPACPVGMRSEKLVPGLSKGAVLSNVLRLSKVLSKGSQRPRLRTV